MPIVGVACRMSGAGQEVALDAKVPVNLVIMPFTQ
jgi:hypothetical protein